jgi:MYXO-CTERM domain-containing protein
MRPPRFRAYAGPCAVASLSLALLGGGCNGQAPPSARSEGPAGQTRAGLTLTTPGFVETTVIQGLNQPTVVRFAGDGRVFVAEKGGKIWVYDKLSDTTPTLFANLTERVHDFWDRGLLGLALDPEFPAKPYVYVLYAYDGDPGGPAPKWGDGCPTPPGATGDGCIVSGRLSRFTANGNLAGDETVLVEGWRQQYPSHSTGQVEFGPDGALYASGGDGASFNFVDYGQDGSPINPLGDPPVAIGAAQTPPSAEGGALRAQSPRRTDGPTLLNGSVIRVSSATGAGMPDNPLAASDDENAKRIIAFGLRNPFRIAARPGKDELWIADVGWNQWEELNRIPLGGAEPLNFGWPCYEGAGKQAGYDAANLALCESLYTAGGHTPPFFTYAHARGVSTMDACGRGSSSVTGVAFYQGNSYPAEYQGALFFADYSRRCIYVMQTGADGEPSPASARSFHVDADEPVFLTTGPGGDLFYAALSSGTIQRISYLRPSAAFTANPKQGQVPLIVNFDAGSSVKALPTDELTYAWDLDGDGDFDDSTEPQPAYLYDVVGNVATRLKVTDQRGISDVSSPLVVKATAEPPPITTPPEVFIDTPSADLHWQVGDTIHFSGHATDAEDGVLPASALSWQIAIQHCPDGCHLHDLLSYPGVTSGSFSAEDHEYPMHLELILTATDSSGQKRSARRPLEPKTVALTFDTEPSGLELVVGSASQPTPFLRRVIVGSENSVSAPDPQNPSGTNWKFSQWSDGLAATHALSAVTVAARYLATYVPGGGLTGEYFDALAFAGSRLTRIDPVIDFNWADGSPDASIGPDTFSVRWSGQIKADFDEAYLFSSTSDDGVRLTIDGTVVIDHFVAHAPTLDTGTVTLTSGWHPIVLEYFENGSGAQVDLSWSSPSQPEQIVPESHLRPGCAGGVCSAGLQCDPSELCVLPCDPATCAASEHCKLSVGACEDLCAGVTCLASDVCNAGICEDRCLHVACDTGQHCALGECVADPPTGGEGGAGGETGDGGEAGNGGSTGGSVAGSGGSASGSGGSTAGGSGSGGTAGGTGGTLGGGGGAISAGNGGVAGVDTTPSEGGAPAAPSEGGAAGTSTTDGPADGGSAGQPPLNTDGGTSTAGVSGARSSGAGGLDEQPTTGGEPASEAGAPSGGSGSGGSSSCSCKTAGGGSPPSGSFAALAVAAAFLFRRRR